MTMVDKPAADRRRAFGDALAHAIAVRGLTQRSLAEHLGIAQSTTAAWKAGNAEPAPETVFEIERALELPPGHLSQHLGYMPPGETGRQSFEEVVADDPLLSDTMKGSILAIYREFVENRRPKRRSR